MNEGDPSVPHFEAFIAEEIRAAEAVARAKALDEAISDVTIEPELPGRMPPVLQALATVSPAEFARITVRLTKRNIAERIRARAKEAPRA